MILPKLVKVLFRIHLNLFENKHQCWVDNKPFVLNKIKIRGTGKDLRYYLFGSYMLIEQNPYKNTQEAKLARKGEKITWLIETKTDKYLYRINQNKIKKL